ncbi:MAG: hypothetical protein J6V09_02920, partial [Clostridia bacterium]|nr:hypothetical protein [Clostridia bacterium]
LAYAVNMWRDYESEQGEAIESFPGFRRLVRDLGAVHGLFAYRAKSGEEYLIVHAGTRLYSFESETVAAMDDVHLTENAALDKVELEDGDSQGFIFNNNLYILDGKHFVVVSGVTDQSGATSVTASEIDAYIPTTYLDGKPLEQRNMLSNYAYQINTGIKEQENPIKLVNILKVADEESYKLFSGIKDNWETNEIVITESSKGVRVEGFNNLSAVQKIWIMVKDSLWIKTSAFQNLPNLKEVTIYVTDTESGTSNIFIGKDEILDVPELNNTAFRNCPNLHEISINYFDNEHHMAPTVESFLPDGIEVVMNFDAVNYGDEFAGVYKYLVNVTEMAEDVVDVINYRTDEPLRYVYKYEFENTGNGTKKIVKRIYLSDYNLAHYGDNGDWEYDDKVKTLLKLYPTIFKTIENAKNFHEGNPDYEGTGVEAINGCTKSAVFDGRIVLTGNPALPNTVFYSNRNLTGANDPTYWGAYNYFNDGDGNTPNVDLLSTPSMLMVLKNNTVQDGSVYYHVGEFNTHEDEIIRNLVPRIYPSTSGAAGLGSAGRTVPGTTACNFLDDPVFLSTRGLEAVGKQTVNLERTLTHRSSNVDRFLIKEDLSRASIAEWKGYLVICCDGRFYLADSRQIHQHPDGSYQYEWYYLEGLGCYDEYSGGYRYINDWFGIDDNGNTLDQCTLVDGRLIGEAFATSDGVFEGDTGNITVYSAQKPDGSQFYFYAHGNLALEAVDEERRGVGEFYPARKIVVVGERLFFGTADGDVCVINTDKRGVPDYEGQDIEPNRISTRWYSFAGVRYSSLCATALDDCTKPMLAKGTIPGTAVARFKMMPGSRVCANVSVNGRDFKKVGEAYASRYDAGSLDFSNFSFTENEDARIVLREFTRNWVDKQYSFVSDGFCEPFGIYEVSYLYVTKGKIRRPFAVIERK